MAIDNYQPCPCGTGKKIKWCRPKAIEQTGDWVSLVQSRDEAPALALVDKLRADPTNPQCLCMLLDCMRANTLYYCGKPEEATVEMQKVAEKYPDYGLPVSHLGRYHMDHGDFAGAVEFFTQAEEKFPPEASTNLSNTAQMLGQIHQRDEKPLAYWACLQRSLRYAPNDKQILETLDHFKNDVRLPNVVRQGLRLKSPDELAVFNDDRRQQWDVVLQSAANATGLDSLVAGFRSLVDDDDSDSAAWYNLGVAHAWNGDNVAAVEALERYAKDETDFEEGVKALEICEILRCARDVSLSDSPVYMFHFAFKEGADPRPFFEKLDATKHIVVLSGKEGERMMFWTNAPQQPSAENLIGQQRRALAEFTVTYPLITFRSYNEADSKETFEQIKKFLDDTIAPVAATMESDGLGSFINEAMFVYPMNSDEARKHADLVKAHIVRHFEEVWLRRPMKSLNGLSPIDAVGSTYYKRHVEAKVRVREVFYSAMNVGYDFRGLRNKLGLEIGGDGAGLDKLHIQAMSPAQLAGLHPAELSDDDLVTAYRACSSLDAGAIALHFGREIVRRDSLAQKLDGFAIYRRLIADRLDRNLLKEAVELIRDADEFDKRTNNGSHESELKLLDAKLLLLEGETDKACQKYVEWFEQRPDDLELWAHTIEFLLRRGLYAKAAEFAEKGMARAKLTRKSDLAEQFKEYHGSATRRK